MNRIRIRIVGPPDIATVVQAPLCELVGGLLLAEEQLDYSDPDYPANAELRFLHAPGGLILSVHHGDVHSVLRLDELSHNKTKVSIWLQPGPTEQALRLLLQHVPPFTLTTLCARNESRRLGPHGGTLDRVLEARRLIELGEKKTNACKRVGIDIRTYDRYIDAALDWEAKEKPPADLNTND
jgi:hypothetical protein